MPKARICIADDHELFRSGLVQLINQQADLEVVGEAGDGLEMLTLARQLKPDLILMDINMPISDGVEATSLIREFDSDTTILMLTALDSDEKLIEAIKAGADGYLLKNTSSDGFLRALRGALAGEATLPRHLTASLVKDYTRLASQPARQAPVYAAPTLTARELQVLQAIASGASNQQIAEQLGISLYTTKSHVRNLLSKLAAESRWQAAEIAQEMGLLRKRDFGRGLKD
ncbi:MAG: response regulator transcription factor [Anaerolineales bacterium]|nr:MAG: response regulator transcription factor [Anaerolineales bacterium]